MNIVDSCCRQPLSLEKLFKDSSNMHGNARWLQEAEKARDWFLPDFLVYKWEGREKYSQACKPMSIKYSIVVESVSWFGQPQRIDTYNAGWNWSPPILELAKNETGMEYSILIGDPSVVSIASHSQSLPISWLQETKPDEFYILWGCPWIKLEGEKCVSLL